MKPLGIMQLQHIYIYRKIFMFLESFKKLEKKTYNKAFCNVKQKVTG